MREQPKEYAEFLTYIQGGAWDHVCARYMGIHPRTFYKWMEFGRENYDEHFDAPEDAPVELDAYGEFYKDVTRAKCKARMNAEVRVKSTHPLYYLRQACKSREGEPGWTEDASEIVIEDKRSNTASEDDALKAGKFLERIMMAQDKFSDTYQQQQHQQDTTDPTPLDNPRSIPYNGNGKGPDKKT